VVLGAAVDAPPSSSVFIIGRCIFERCTFISGVRRWWFVLWLGVGRSFRKWLYEALRAVVGVVGCTRLYAASLAVRSGWPFGCMRCRRGRCYTEYRWLYDASLFLAVDDC